jgi:hypothetical protein
MYAPSESPEPADLAAEASGLSVGLGILAMTFFPFALPGLLLALLLVLPAVPLALAGVVVFLAGRALLLILRRGGALVRNRSRRRGTADATKINVVPDAATAGLRSASLRRSAGVRPPSRARG